MKEKIKKRVLNFGSINIDHSYRVERFALPGETLSCEDYRCSAGGKGLNQSIALAQAGAEVYHVGRIGKDGIWLAELMHKKGVNTKFTETLETATGNAVIEVNAKGENLIMIFGGTNRLFSEDDIERALAPFGENDYLLVQNEVNLVPEIIRAGKAKGMKIVFNPSPMTVKVLEYPLDLVDILFVNQSEAHALTNASSPDEVYQTLAEKYPKIKLVLTLGCEGAFYFTSKEERFFQASCEVSAVDTTGAGDTFTGFFVAGLIKTDDPKFALSFATRAAGIAVTRYGAADSIPTEEEVSAVK